VTPFQTDSAALLLRCPESVNITSILADFFARKGVNVKKHAQYLDDGWHFLRIEWLSSQVWATEVDCLEELNQALVDLPAQFSVRLKQQAPSVGLFCSDQMHVVSDVLGRTASSGYPTINVPFVVSDHEPSRGVADRFGVPFFYIPSHLSASEIQHKQLEIIDRYQPQILGLARYDNVLSQSVIDRANCSIMTVHNSFLPSIKGEKAYSLAYEQGLKLVGATARMVETKSLGPIVTQDVIKLGPGLSESEVKLLGQKVERKVFAAGLRKLAEHKVMVYNAKTIVFE